MFYLFVSFLRPVKTPAPEDRHGWCPHQPVKMPESVIAHTEPGNLMLIFIVSLQNGYLGCYHC